MRPPSIVADDGTLRIKYSMEYLAHFLADLCQPGQEDRVRTDCILENIFAYVLKDLYTFEAKRPQNAQEQAIVENISVIFSPHLPGKRTPRQENPNPQVSSYFLLLALFDHIFLDSITWRNIQTYFLFVNGMIGVSISRVKPREFVETVYAYVSRLVKDRLGAWIKDQGGWKGFTPEAVSRKPPPATVAQRPWSHLVLQRQKATAATQTVRQREKATAATQTHFVSSENVCVICCDAARSILFERCGHFVSCEPCSRNLETCPMCRKSIMNRKIKVFMS